MHCMVNKHAVTALLLGSAKLNHLVGQLLWLIEQICARRVQHCTACACLEPGSCEQFGFGGWFCVLF